MAAVNVINAKKPFIVTSRSEVNRSRMNPEPALKVGVVRTGWKLGFKVRPAAAIPVGVASFSQYAAASSQSYALPKNLPSAIRYLDDDQLDRLLAAVLAERADAAKRFLCQIKVPARLWSEWSRLLCLKGS
jgi:hypothetical protein